MSGLHELKQYYWDRQQFVDAFDDVFYESELMGIEEMCIQHTELNDFLLWHSQFEEFYIIHLPSGTMINWYKHLGRANTCNNPDLDIDGLKELLQSLRNEMIKSGKITGDSITEAYIETAERPQGKHLLRCSRDEKDCSAYIEGYKATKAEFERPQDHWEDITPPGAFTPGGDPIGRCPICKSGESIHNIGVEGPHWNFCPICGTQMVDATNIEKGCN